MTTETKHTPNYSLVRTPSSIIITTLIDGMTVSTHHFDKSTTTTEKALSIVKASFVAPELLEALKNLCQLGDDDGSYSAKAAKARLLEVAPEFVAYLAQARAAIAKATK